MFKKTICSAMLLAFLGSQVAWAGVEPSPWDWGFNVDGNYQAISLSDDPAHNSPASIPNLIISNSEPGLETFQITVNGAGNHNIASFFDYEIDEGLNTYFNEQGQTVGDPMDINPPNALLTWEVDEPGYDNNIHVGDIFYNFKNNTYDNTIFDNNPTMINDVSVGLGWNFTLANDEFAIATFKVSEAAPDSRFYISQIDPDSHKNLYFTTSMTIGGGGHNVPEPATYSMLVFGLGLVGLFAAKKRN
jgi:hypothetical protein